MKFNFSVFVYILVGVLIFSCAEKPYHTTTISFNLKEKPRSIFETGVVKSVKLVRLESDSCIIGRIDKIIRNDSLLYIMDNSITNCVYVFTIDGSFVNIIAKQGHGRFEYAQLYDIFFDKENKTLCLLSRYDQKVISFSPDGKKVLEESLLPKMFARIVSTTDGYVGYMQNYSQSPNIPDNLWIMDKSYNLLESFMRINPKLESRTQGGIYPISTYGNVIYFKPEFENTIYQIKDRNVCPCYMLDFGEKTVPELSSISIDGTRDWQKLMMEKVANINNYVETDDNLLMNFKMDAQHWLGIYDKNKHTSEIASLDCYEDDYFFSFGEIRGMDRSAIYSTIEYEDVYDVWVGHNKYVNFEDEYPKQVNNLRKLFPKLEEDGNPFIAIYSLK